MLSGSTASAVFWLWQLHTCCRSAHHTSACLHTWDQSTNHHAQNKALDLLSTDCQLVQSPTVVCVVAYMSITLVIWLPRLQRSSISCVYVCVVSWILPQFWNTALFVLHLVHGEWFRNDVYFNLALSFQVLWHANRGDVDLVNLYTWNIVGGKKSTFSTVVHVRKGLNCRKGHDLNVINVSASLSQLNVQPFHLYIIFFWKPLFILNTVGLDLQSVSNLSVSFLPPLRSFPFQTGGRRGLFHYLKARSDSPLKVFSPKSIKNLREQYLLYYPT